MRRRCSANIYPYKWREVICRRAFKSYKREKLLLWTAVVSS